MLNKIVFTTGDTVSRDTAAFLAETKAPYVKKPVDIDALIETVNSILPAG